MKRSIIFPLVFSLLTLTLGIKAQDRETPEKYGRTLNLGAGIGYYGYVGHAVPIGAINYEFDVFKNFTLAPFAGIYSYQSSYYWGDPYKPSGDPTYRKYSYRSTAVPIGLKGTYYFDGLFKSNSRWDFYAAGSAGFVFRKTVWESGYYGDVHVRETASPLYLDAHIGGEYHMTERTGFFVDLSTGVSTVGLAFHFQ